MKSVLVICVGNICRSPMAEGLLASQLPGVQVASAGIGALIGRPADPEAVALMRDRGIDISTHVAQQISKGLCQRAEIILVMDNEQKRLMESKYPFARGKIFRIGESSKIDIPDPYRQPKEAFEHALALLDIGVSDWVIRISKITERERQFI